MREFVISLKTQGAFINMKKKFFVLTILSAITFQSAIFADQQFNNSYGAPFPTYPQQQTWSSGQYYSYENPSQPGMAPPSDMVDNRYFSTQSNTRNNRINQANRSMVKQNREMWKQWLNSNGSAPNTSKNSIYYQGKMVPVEQERNYQQWSTSSNSAQPNTYYYQNYEVSYPQGYPVDRPPSPPGASNGTIYYQQDYGMPAGNYQQSYSSHELNQGFMGNKQSTPFYYSNPPATEINPPTGRYDKQNLYESNLNSGSFSTMNRNVQNY